MNVVDVVIAVAAILQRLGHAYADSILAVEPADDHPGAVLLHVNSGGNSLAVEQALAGHGYRCEMPGERGLVDVVYGVRMLVRPPA